MQETYLLTDSVRQWSGRPGFTPKSSHTKDSKNLDTALLNTLYYKVRFKGKVKQSRESNSILLYTSLW